MIKLKLQVSLETAEFWDIWNVDPGNTERRLVEIGIWNSRVTCGTGVQVCELSECGQL